METAQTKNFLCSIPSHTIRVLTLSLRRCIMTERRNVRGLCGPWFPQPQSSQNTSSGATRHLPLKGKAVIVWLILPPMKYPPAASGHRRFVPAPRREYEGSALVVLPALPSPFLTNLPERESYKKTGAPGWGSPCFRLSRSAFAPAARAAVQRGRDTPPQSGRFHVRALSLPSIIF